MSTTTQKSFWNWNWENGGKKEWERRRIFCVATKGEEEERSKKEVEGEKERKEEMRKRKQFIIHSLRLRHSGRIQANSVCYGQGFSFIFAAMQCKKNACELFLFPKKVFLSKPYFLSFFSFIIFWLFRFPFPFFSFPFSFFRFFFFLISFSLACWWLLLVHLCPFFGSAKCPNFKYNWEKKKIQKN